MDAQVYTISQAAKAVGESTSVLRYWEEVLEIRVNRNPKGYRCYTGYDIQLFLNIKELKKRGLKLDAIRELIPRIYQYGPGSPKSRTRLLEESEEAYPVDCIEDEEQEIQEAEIWDEEQIQVIEEAELPEIQPEVPSVESEQLEPMQPEIPGVEPERMQEEIHGTGPKLVQPEDIPAGPAQQMHHAEDFRMAEFQSILEKLIAQGMKEKNQEELRIRKLDEKIRFHQQGLKQVAAAHEMKQRRGRGKRRKR